VIDLDEIRKEVAVKHGVLLDENDPVLVTVTLNDIILSHYVEKLNSQNETHQRGFSAALDEAVEKSIAESRKVAGRIVTDGANYVTDHCKTAIEDAMASAVREARAEIKGELVNSKKAVRDFRASSFVAGMIFSCAISVVTIVMMRVFL
jgi:hypothetical protein